MNCRYVQSHLSAYIDMELTGAEQQRIRAHIECCMECSAEYETLRQVKGLMQCLPTIVPVRGEEVILKRIWEHRAVQREARRTRPYTRWWRYAWGAVAVALVMWFTPGDESSPVRSLQSDTLTAPLINSSPKRTFLFPSFRRSEPLPLTHSPSIPAHNPVVFPLSESPSPFAPNPTFIPVVENDWGTTGTLQPTFEILSR